MGFINNNNNKLLNHSNERTIMNNGVEFKKVGFIVTGMIKGQIKLPFISTDQSTYRLAPNLQDIEFIIGEHHIKIEADSEIAEVILANAFFGTDDVDIFKEDFFINIKDYVISRYNFWVLTGGLLVQMPANPTIQFVDGIVLNDNVTFAPGKVKHKIIISAGTRFDEVDCSFNPLNCSQIPFIDIKNLEGHSLFLNTNFTFDDNMVPANKYKIEFENGYLTFTDENGAQDTWEDGYAIVAYNNNITNIWLDDTATTLYDNKDLHWKLINDFQI